MEKHSNTYLVTFKTHFGAIRYKKACAASGISASMMAVPRELSTSCGNCLTFEAESLPQFDDSVLKDVGRVYLVSDGGYFCVE